MSPATDASSEKFWREQTLPRELLAELPLELRFEVLVEMAREAVRVALLPVPGLSYWDPETQTRDELRDRSRFMFTRTLRLKGLRSVQQAPARSPRAES